jgi:hypothetical protein
LRAESNPVQRGHPSADGIPVIAETLTFGYRPQRPAGTPTHLTRLVGGHPQLQQKTHLARHL